MQSIDRAICKVEEQISEASIGESTQQLQTNLRYTLAVVSDPTSTFHSNLNYVQLRWTCCYSSDAYVY